jgi:hypothetical protein
MAYPGAVSIPNAINGSLSGAGSLQVVIPFQGRHAMSLVETYNQDAVHTLVATLTLEISNNWRVEMPAANVRWSLVTDPTIATALSTDQTASPAGAKPNGTASTSGFGLQIDPLRCSAFRWTVTWVSGNGSYTLDVECE